MPSLNGYPYGSPFNWPFPIPGQTNLINAQTLKSKEPWARQAVARRPSLRLLALLQLSQPVPVSRLKKRAGAQDQNSHVELHKGMFPFHKLLLGKSHLVDKLANLGWLSNSEAIVHRRSPNLVALAALVLFPRTLHSAWTSDYSAPDYVNKCNN